MALDKLKRDASNKAYRDRHKERVAAASRKWEKEHPEIKRMYDKKYRTANREKTLMANKKWRNANPKKDIKRHLMAHYNMTVDEYNFMFESQQGKCAICGQHQSELTKALFVDHNHETGKIRGLLCSKCNAGIGFFHDDIALLNIAIEYLEKND